MMIDAPTQSTTPWSAVLLILTTILITCFSVISSDYAFSDDYWVLAIRPLNSHTILQAVHGFLGEGRLLYSVWALGIMGHVNGIQTLKFVRLLTLFGVFLSAMIIYKLLRRYLIKNSFNAALVSCIFSINPSFLIMVAWAEIGCDSYACFFGLLSIYILLPDSWIHTPSHLANPTLKYAAGALPSYIRPLLSILLLFIALCLYQPGAMLFWTGVCIWIIGRFDAKRGDLLVLANIIIVFISALGLYFIFSSALADPNLRFHVSISIIRRMGWFVLYPLKNALCYPLIQPFDPWSIAALLILSLGIWRYCHLTSRTMWIPPLILSITPLTVLPTIFAYNHYDVSRTRTALYGLIIIIWYTTFQVIVEHFKKTLTIRRILLPALILLVLFGEYHLQRYLIIPQIREESALLIKLQEYVRENPKLDRLIVIWPPLKSHPMTEFQPVDEMGIASLSQPWATDQEIKLILAGVTNHNYEDVADVKILHIYGDEISIEDNPVPPQDAFIIDFRQLHAPQ